MGASLDAPFRKGHRGTNNFYAIPPYLCLCDFFVNQLKIFDFADKVTKNDRMPRPMSEHFTYRSWTDGYRVFTSFSQDIPVLLRGIFTTHHPGEPSVKIKTVQTLYPSVHAISYF